VKIAKVVKETMRRHSFEGGEDADVGDDGDGNDGGDDSDGGFIVTSWSIVAMVAIA